MLFSIPVSFTFSTTVVLSTFFALSASNWLTVWLALEINMLSFIPMMVSNNSNQEAEAGVKYFLAQATGSILFITGALMMPMTTNASISAFFVIFGLALKAGMAPCHFWFPQVMASISWPTCLVLSTWQKLIPMMTLFLFLPSSATLASLSMLSAITGALGTLNQTHMRPLMAYSSINHMGWMLAASIASLSTAYLYLFTYILMISPLMLSFSAQAAKPYSPHDSLMWNTPSSRISILLLMMSLGGLPPLLGFFPKITALTSMSQEISPVLPLTLIISSLITLYLYLNIFFSSYINNRPTLMNQFNSTPTPTMSILASLSLGLPTIFMISALILLN